MSSIHPLAEENIKAASQSRSRAYMNDPLQTYVFPDADERSHKSPAHFEAVLRYGYKTPFMLLELNLFYEVFQTRIMVWNGLLVKSFIYLIASTA